MIRRKQIESERKDMEMNDPYWSLYRIEGPTLDKIVESKPAIVSPGKILVWSKDKGWEEVNAK